MDDESFVNINENCDAGDERFVELRGIQDNHIDPYKKIIDFFF